MNLYLWDSSIQIVHTHFFITQIVYMYIMELFMIIIPFRMSLI